MVEAEHASDALFSLLQYYLAVQQIVKLLTVVLTPILKEGVLSRLLVEAVETELVASDLPFD
jgi:hypothetical protein